MTIGAPAKKHRLIERGLGSGVEDLELLQRREPRPLVGGQQRPPPGEDVIDLRDGLVGRERP